MTNTTAIFTARTNKSNLAPFPLQGRARVSMGLDGVRAATRREQSSPLPDGALRVMTRGRSRMRQFRSYGSVRGAEGNLRPYRDPLLFLFFSTYTVPFWRSRWLQSDLSELPWSRENAEEAPAFADIECVSAIF